MDQSNLNETRSFWFSKISLKFFFKGDFICQTYSMLNENIFELNSLNSRAISFYERGTQNKGKVPMIKLGFFWLLIYPDLMMHFWL